MNLDRAVDITVGDSKRDELVVGKTEKELHNTFGFLLSPANASPYLQRCY